MPTKTTGKMALYARKREMLLTDYRFKDLSSVVAGRKLGVPSNTIWAWRKKAGIKVYNKWDDQVAALEADPDFGLETGYASVTVKTLRERHNIADSTVRRRMDKYGIKRLKDSKSVNENEIRNLLRSVGWC